MNSLNSVQLIGNLGQDPEMVNFENGNKLAKFSIATTKYFKDVKGELQSKTEWHNIVAWGQKADAIEKYTTKGSRVFVQGELETRKWEDKEGNKRQLTQVNCLNIIFLDRRNDQP